MKGILGSIILFVCAGALLAYVPKADSNQWIIMILFFGAAIGLDLSVSGMIDTRIDGLREELKNDE